MAETPAIGVVADTDPPSSPVDTLVTGVVTAAVAELSAPSNDAAMPATGVVTETVGVVVPTLEDMDPPFEVAETPATGIATEIPDAPAPFGCPPSSARSAPAIDAVVAEVAAPFDGAVTPVMGVVAGIVADAVPPSSDVDVLMSGVLTVAVDGEALAEPLVIVATMPAPGVLILLMDEEPAEVESTPLFVTMAAVIGAVVALTPLVDAALLAAGGTVGRTLDATIGVFANPEPDVFAETVDDA